MQLHFRGTVNTADGTRHVSHRAIERIEIVDVDN
jgi:hypothetical protein